ncbi:hypothetical protein KI387_012964, partial [Taxus chinensis]
ARQQLTMWDRMPPLLVRMRPHVSAAHWVIMREVGLGGVQRYRAIDRDHSLMVALIERWDPATNVFHLLTGEMTITLEDVYHILRLPIEGEVVFQIDSETAMDSILQVFGDAAALLTYHSASIRYGDMYHAHRHETRLAVLMMIGITYFALPDSEGGRFPQALMGVLLEMVEEHTCYAWAPVYLLQLYRELWGYCRMRPVGLPQQPGPQVIYRYGFQRWLGVVGQPRAVLAGWDVAYYRHLLEGLTMVDIVWRPYRGHHPHRGARVQLRWIQYTFWIAGRRPGEYERIPLERVRRQMGLRQDEPPPFPQYKRDDVEAPLPAPQPLDPDWVAERPADDTVDDAGCTGAYMVWWAGQRAARVAQPAQPDLATMTAERDQLRGQVQLLQGQLAATQAQIGILQGQLAQAQVQAQAAPPPAAQPQVQVQVQVAVPATTQVPAPLRPQAPAAAPAQA